MVTILPALGQVREDLVRLLDRATVERLCDEVGHRWRDRDLDPYTTLHLFILQVVNNNTAMTHLPHLSGKRFTASAYCQARQRLPLAFFERIVGQFAGQLNGAADGSRWRGHRVWISDGSGFSMPDTPELQRTFGQPGGQKPGCGFPVAHVLALFDAHRGLLRDVITAPLRTQDIALVFQQHSKLSAGDVLVADRGFCSYAHLALISQAHLHSIFRIHQCQIVDFRPHRPSAAEAEGPGRPRSRWIRRLGYHDQLVEWHKPVSRPRWMSSEQFAKLPDRVVVRELRYRIRERGCRVQEVTLATTLLDPKRYPAAEIARLYRQRWQVEVDLRDLKITLGMDVLKGQKRETVMKELLVFMLVYNLVRLTIVKSAQRQRIAPRRISFIDALRWLQPPKPFCALPDLIVNPTRSGRIEPRCIKRRMKEYNLMTAPRRELRKRLKKKREAA
jgi:hypothetical protein